MTGHGVGRDLAYVPTLAVLVQHDTACVYVCVLWGVASCPFSPVVYIVVVVVDVLGFVVVVVVVVVVVLH